MDARSCALRPMKVPLRTIYWTLEGSQSVTRKPGAVRQPDFCSNFFDTFGEVSGPLRYEVRKDSNFIHDLEFINSLVHDAEFLLDETRNTKRSFEIPLIRIRWERRGEVKSQQVTKTPATLRFKGVKSVQWIAGSVRLAAADGSVLFDESDAVTTKNSLEVYRVFAAESTFSPSATQVEIVLAGYPSFWQLRLWLTPIRWSIELADLSNAS